MFHPNRRQSEILKSVRLKGACSIVELANDLRVSEETIRRDVRPMAAEGMLLRNHGRVVSPERIRETPFQSRMQEQKDEKQRIAIAAASLIKDGDSLIIDSGTTTSYVAKALSEHSNLVVVTNSIDIAYSLSVRNGNRVYMVGGRLRNADGASLGPSAVDFVEQFTVQHAILSIKAINVEHGLMNAYLSEAEFSRAVVQQAETVTVVADHTKFGQKSFVSVCGIDQIHRFISSDNPPPDISESLDSNGVEFRSA